MSATSPTLSAIQWAAERVADHVAALGETHPAHLPLCKGADAEEDAPDPNPEPAFGPGCFLEFEIVGPREFLARVDGADAVYTVTYSGDFKKAVVLREDGAVVGCDDGDLQVAETLLDFDSRLAPEPL